MGIGTQQTQNIRQFVTTHLSDVLDANLHVRPDPHRQTTGDIAYCEIVTPFNKYRLAMGSAYAEPPHGASNECRSLGWITFDDNARDKHWLKPKGDLAFNEISKHIHEHELTDALADGRRKVAEASGFEVADAKLKLREIAAKAEKWGIKANLPEEAKQQAAPNAAPVLIPNSPLAAPAAYIPLAPMQMVALRGPAPFVGAQIMYYGSDRIAGMDQIPGMLVKIQRDGRAAMFLMADLNEITYLDNIHRRGSDAGNGNVHTTNCWDFNPQWLAEQERIQHIYAYCDSMKAQLEKLEERLVVLEAKPKRGRPPNAAKSAADGEEIEGAELASELKDDPLGR